MTNPDESLEARLRERILQQSDGDTDTDPDGSTDAATNTDTDTETEAKHDDGDGDMDDEDDDGSESEMGEEMEQAVQMIAEAADAEVTTAQVEEMLAPLFGEVDTTDDPGEMAADVDAEALRAELDINSVVEEAVGDAVDEAVGEKLPDSESLATQSDIDEAVEEQLDEVVDALADETRDVIQQAETASTPTPTQGGHDPSLSKADLVGEDANYTPDSDGESEADA